MKIYRLFYLIVAVALTVSGCGVKEKYPAYFVPIIEELEKHPEKYKNSVYFTMEKWWEQGAQTGIYEKKKYTSYFDGVTNEFDLSSVLTESETWDWMTAGAFQLFEKNRAYIVLVDFNLALEEGTEPAPQILLLDFALDNPEEYKLTAYTVEPAKKFCYVEQCYLLGDSIYIASKDQALGRIKLQTKEFYDCEEEWQSVREYVDKEFEEGYYPFAYRTVLTQDGITVYSAEITEANDVPCIGVVFMACREGKPIAFMNYDLQEEDFEIKDIEN